MANKCKRCVRYHPKALGNCNMAKSIANLEGRYKFTLEVTKCPEYLAPEKVFTKPTPKKEATMAPTDEVAPVKIGCTCDGYFKYKECDCEGEG